MVSVSIPLEHILFDTDSSIDLPTLPPNEVEAVVRDAYAFLPAPLDITVQDGVAHIASLKKPAKNIGDVPELMRRATKFSGQANYARAIELYTRVLERDPGNIEARRNLGMALMETGNVRDARIRLVETARLAPDDVWAYLILANSYAKPGTGSADADIERALHFYRLAYTYGPDDLYVITSFAGALAKTGRLARANELLEKAQSIDPAYPNAAYGRALLALDEGNAEKADQILVSLFRQPVYRDPRSQPVYEVSRALALEANQKLAETTQAEMQAVIETRRVALEESGGIPIVLEIDNAIATNAITKMAWNYGETKHRILYKNTSGIAALHYIAHELEHIELEGEARSQERHRAFTATADSVERAFRSLDREINPLRQRGMSELMLTQAMTQMIHGLNGQVFNHPLDMLIEWRLARHLPELRPAQLLSLFATNKENMKVFHEPAIRKMTPVTIYNANTALNYAFALYTDWLFEGRTALAEETRQTGGLSTHGQKNGEQIFDMWRDMMGVSQAGDDAGRYAIGDEYGFVDRVAELLGLADWYDWRFQHEEGEFSQPIAPSPLSEIEETPEGATNPELLRSKDRATTMYLLSALQRFESMSRSQVQQITFEIAMVGRDGIDYADPDRKYHLSSLPDEEFTGLKLLTMMYVGFKQIAPDEDTGLDFDQPYALALQMYEKRSG